MSWLFLPSRLRVSGTANVALACVTHVPDPDYPIIQLSTLLHCCTLHVRVSLSPLLFAGNGNTRNAIGHSSHSGDSHIAAEFFSAKLPSFEAPRPATPRLPQSARRSHNFGTASAEASKAFTSWRVVRCSLIFLSGLPCTPRPPRAA